MYIDYPPSVENKMFEKILRDQTKQQVTYYIKPLPKQKEREVRAIWHDGGCLCPDCRWYYGRRG